MRYLRTNTACRITVGPFFDKTDGVTPETALTVTNCKLTFMVDDANVPTLVLDAAATASGGSNDMVHVTNDDAGFYDLELSAANVNYLGRAMLAITDAANHCPVFHEFMIVPAVVYDAMILGTDLLDVSMTQILGTAVSTPATAGILDVNVKNMNNVAATSITTINANQGTTQPVNFTGTGATAYAKTDMVDILGTAVSTPTTAGILDVNIKNIANAAVSTSTAQLGVNLVNIAGAAVSTSTAQLGVNAVNIGGSAAASATIGTVTNLTNAATNGDLTATMKTSVTTACTASTPTISTLGANTITATSIATGAITNAKFASGAIDAAAIAADAIGASELAADAVTEIVAGVWGALRASYVADGTMGQYMALLDSGTAQTGAGATITLRSGASAVNDYYDGAIIQLIGGTGIGQARVIKQYVGASKIATVADNWGTTPDATSVYIIRGLGDVEVGINNDKTGYSLAADQAVNVTKWNGTTVATPATAGIPDVNVKNINNIATTSVTTINANQGTTQPVNYTGTGASALVKSDMVDIAGAAVSTSTAQIGANAVQIGGVVPGSATIGTVTTVTNQLTAAAIATGVWQDATAGDFTAASSIGKALYIANIAPGASGGHMISGTNAGTTTLGALTVTGATTLTGAVTATNISNDINGCNVQKINSQSVTAGAGITVNANVGTTQPINFTGTASNALVKSDMVDIAGAAVSTSTAQIGVNVVSASGGVPSTADIADAVWDEQLGGHTTAGSAGKALSDAGSGASASTIADAVWDEAISGHLTAGTTGAKLNSAASAGDPWSTAVPGAYSAGSAGYILGTNLDAKSSDIKTQTDKMQFDGSNNIKSVKNATTAGTADFNATEKASITTACTASTPTVDANLTKILGTAVSSPATAGILDVNVKNMNNVAATNITTINANQGTTQPVNYTGTGASALVKTDMVDVAGAAVSTSVAQIGANTVSISSGAITDASVGTDNVVKALRTGTAQAGSSNTITLDAGASSIDDFYSYSTIKIGSGTGANQERTIIIYNGTTKVATVDRPWRTTPANDSAFVIDGYRKEVTLLRSIGYAQTATSDTIKLKSTESSTDDIYTGMLISIIGGTGNTQVRTISHYNGSSLFVTVDRPWTVTPDSTSIYAISSIDAVGPSHALHYDHAQAGASTTITLSSNASNIDSFYNGNIIQLIAGQGAGQARVIKSYVGSTRVATVMTAWGTNPNSTTHYGIYALGDVQVGNIAEIIDGVWDEARSGHTTVGTFGENVNSNMIKIAGTTVNTSIAQIGVNVVSQDNIDFGALQKASLNTATPASITGSVGSVTGNVGGNVTGSVGSIATNGITATSIASDAINAASIKADTVTKIQNGLATPTNITAGTITTVTNLTNAPTNGDFTSTMKTSLNAATPTVTISDKTGFSLSTAGNEAVSDTVWDEMLSGHTTIGSAGQNLNSVGIASDPWLAPIPGAYTDGMAGEIMGKLDTIVDKIDTMIETDPDGINH